MVGRIKSRFSIKRVILVCDRGMVSRENIAFLEKEEFGYILRVRLRRVKRAIDVPSWYEIIRDLRAFQAVKIQIDGKAFLVRSDFAGVAHRCFMAAGVKPPPQITKM